MARSIGSQRVRGSIVPRIMLSVVAVLSAAIGLQSLLTWREVRRAADATAHIRVRQLSDQLHDALERSSVDALRRAQLQADPSRVRDSLDAFVAASPTIVAVDVLAADGTVIRAVGDDRPWRASARADLVRRGVLRSDAAAIGPLTTTPEGVVASVHSPIRFADTSRGVLIIWRAFDATAVRRLAGGIFTLHLGSTDGLWTRLDLAGGGSARRVAVSPIGSAPDSTTALVERRAVEGTPWELGVAMPRVHVRAEVRAIMTRVLLTNGLVLLIAMFVAWQLTRRLTKPLTQLTQLVERVAEGDYAQPAHVVERDDEFGQLAHAFKAMVARVDDAFESRRESERQARGLFEAVPLPIWVFDIETLGVMAVNDAAIAHYGYSRDEFLELTIDRLRPAEDVPRLRETIASPHTPLFSAGRWRHVKRDGSIILVDVVGHSLQYQG